MRTLHPPDLRPLLCVRCIAMPQCQTLCNSKPSTVQAAAFQSTGKAYICSNMESGRGKWVSKPQELPKVVSSISGNASHCIHCYSCGEKSETIFTHIYAYFLYFSALILVYSSACRQCEYFLPTIEAASASLLSGAVRAFVKRYKAEESSNVLRCKHPLSLVKVFDQRTIA